MLNFKKLETSEVVEVYKLMDEDAIDKGFTELSNYLDNFPADVNLISDLEMRALKELVMEINRIFCDDSLLEQRNTLIVKIMKIMFRSQKIDVSFFKIIDIVMFCKNVKDLKSKSIHNGIIKYLNERISDMSFCSEKELEDVEDLIIEIERIFCLDNQEEQKQELLKKILELVILSNNQMKIIKELPNTCDLTFNDLLKICNESKIDKEELFEIINNFLQFRIENRRCLKLDEYGDIESLKSTIKILFSEKIHQLERQELLKKIANLKDSFIGEIANNCSVKEITDFFKVYNSKESIKIIIRYFAKRINLRKIFTEEELKDRDLLICEISKMSYPNNVEKLKENLFSNINALEKLSEILKDRTGLEKKFEKVKRRNFNVSNAEFNNIRGKIISEFSKEIIDYDFLADLLTKFGDLFSYIPITKKNIIGVKEMLKYINQVSYIEPKADDSFRKIVSDCMAKLKVAIHEDRNIMKSGLIRNAIINGDIVLKRTYDKAILDSINYCSEQLDTVDKTIYAIDSKRTRVVDGAFSITQDAGCYIFDVYIPDVPSFLKDNRKIASEAYRRGTSISFVDCDNNNSIRINMLPFKLIKSEFSLLNNQVRKVLDFQYIFNNDGSFDSVNVSRKEIRVTHNLDNDYVCNLMEGNISDNFGILDDFLLAQDLIGKVVNQSDCSNLKACGKNNGAGFANFASVLTNYYLGHKSKFAIYYNNGVYVRSADDFYTNSVTPLRKYVSDINLAFFENQLGLQSFNDKDLNFVENNIDEIIEHLNQQNMVAEFAQQNYQFVKKYLR